MLTYRFRPRVLSPEIQPGLLGIEFQPRLLRASFEPMLLSPRIWAELLHVQGRFVELLESRNRPRLLSPDIFLELLHLRPTLRLLTQQWNARVGAVHSLMLNDHAVVAQSDD